MAVATKRDFSISYGLQTDNTGSSTGDTLSVDQINDKVGINQGTPAYDLDVTGDINFTGILYKEGEEYVASSWTLTGSDIYRLSKVGIQDSTLSSTLSISNIYGLDATSSSISTTTPTVVDSFTIATFRSAKIQVQITQGTDYQVSDILLIHDGTTPNIIEYGTIATNNYLASFSTNISSDTARLLVTMTSSASSTIKVVSQKIKL